ncbi:MAG: PAS domain S-box protein, partial [Rhodocyclaceae bacterium]|nr:PAS domain S-box protein [Rhodocyclaceae bacterium]
MTSDSQRLIALYRITSDSALGLDAKVARLLAFGCETFGLSVGILARIDIGAGRHECVAVSPASMGLSRGEVRPLGDTYCSRTIESPEPVGFTRASGSAWERHPCWAATRLEAYFGARVMVDGAVWGTLSFASLTPVEQEFSRADQHFLQLMAQWVGAEFERGQREEALAVMTDWQRAILDGASYSIIATDPEGIILSFNAAAEHMLGYRADELVGKFSPAVLHDPEEVVARAASLSEEMGENIAPGFAVFVAKTLRGVAEEREWTYIRRDGSRVPVLLSVTTLRKGDGSIRGYLGIARDISRQRELEGALRQSEESYRSVVSSMAEGVIVRSVDGRVITANPAAQRILGLGEADLLSRSVAGEARLLAVHEDGRPFAPEEHPTARTLASGESVR